MQDACCAVRLGALRLFLAVEYRGTPARPALVQTDLTFDVTMVRARADRRRGPTRAERPLQTSGIDVLILTLVQLDEVE